MRATQIKAVTELPGARLIGRRINWYGRVTSTMDVARREASRGGSDGLVVVADEQTAGRGRHARPWLSAAGDDLLFSVALRPRGSETPQLSMLAGLAVAKAADRLAGVSSTIKWPNDVRVDGRKIGGILIETHVMGASTLAVMGVGLNVNMAPARWPEIAQTATSLRAVIGEPVDREHALTTVLGEMDALYERLRSGESLTAEWAGRIDTIGRDIELQFGDEVVRGRAESVDDAGGLVLRTSDGAARTFTAGEVTLQSAASRCSAPHGVENDG